MPIQKTLETILGLSDTEASIYVACLPHGSLGVQEIVKLTGIKRTTVYHAVDTLAFKGLATKKSVGKKMSYTMLTPQSLQHVLSAQKQKIEEQQRELRDIIPELESIRKDSLSNTQVEYYQGVAGVKAIYEEALYCKSRHWDTITPKASFLGQYGKDFHDYVAQTKRDRRIVSRALWEDAKKHKARTPTTAPGKRVVRIMPLGMQGKFSAKIIIFDNKVAIINSAKDAGGVIISSSESTGAFQALFDTVWEISEPFVGVSYT